MNKLKFLKNIFPVFILPILISCGGGDSTPAPIPTYTITASAGDNGAISPTSVTVMKAKLPHSIFLLIMGILFQVLLDAMEL